MGDEELTSYILRHFKYENGALVRDDRRNSLGSKDKDGYVIVKVKKKQFKAHRVVWLVCNGEWPNGEIDHINHKRDDNRIENLRVVSRMENIANIERRPNPITGVVGVHVDNSTKGLKAKYTFKHNGKTYRFRTLEEAVKARGEL